MISTPRSSRFPRSLLLVLLLVLLLAAPLPGLDCNRNGTEDGVDISSASSLDCDDDGIPDECEFPPLPIGIFDEGPPVTDRTRVAASADLNGDGLDDLALGAVQPGGASTVFVVQTTTERLFAPAAEYAAGNDLTALVAKDLDGDGPVDLVVAAEEGLLVFGNRGDGTFAAPVTHPLSGTPELLSVADVTGDGRLDAIAVLSFPERGVEILRSTIEGSYESLGTVALEARPEASLVADLDSDGDEDVAVLSRSSRLIALYWNEEGNGRLSAPEMLPVPGRSPFALVAADLDGNGHEDLAVAGLQGLDLFFGAAERDFPEHRSIAISPSSLAVGDIEGDGDSDLLVGSASSSLVTVLVNDGAGRFGPSAINSSRRVTWRPLTLSPGDFDGDGDVDVAVTDKNSEKVNVLWNGEAGVATAGMTRRAVIIRVGFKPHAAVGGDFNGDGVPDVATANGDGQNVSLLFGTGTGSFEEPTKDRHYFFDGSGHLNHITAGDLDADGDLDLAAVEREARRVGILRNRGDGTFDPRTHFPAGTTVYHVQAGDLDADGDLDLAVANAGDNTASLLFNAGDATFSTNQTLNVETQPESVALDDFDADGDLDIAVANRVSSSLSLFFRTPDGAYSSPPPIPTLGIAISIASGDFDQDGDADLVSINKNDAEVFFNTRTPDLERGGIFPLESAQPPFSVTISDMNSDTIPDLLTANFFARTLSVLIGRGDGTFHLPYELTTGQVTRAVVVDDFDGDGDLDALAANRVTEDANVFNNELQRPVVPHELPTGKCTALAGFRRGDTNSDGRVNLSDALLLLNALFRRGPVPACAASADINDSARVDLLDPIHLLTYLFRDGAPPAEPFPSCGEDPTEDTLTCADATPCS